MDNEINTSCSDVDFYDRQHMRLRQREEWDRLTLRSAQNAEELNASLAEMDRVKELRYSDDEYDCADEPYDQEGYGSLVWVIFLAFSVVGLQALLRWT